MQSNSPSRLFYRYILFSMFPRFDRSTPVFCWSCKTFLPSLLWVSVFESSFSICLRPRCDKNPSDLCLYNQTVQASIFIIHFPCWYFLPLWTSFFLLQRLIVQFISKIYLTISVFWVSVLFCDFIAYTLKTSSIIRSNRMIWMLMMNSWEKRWASIVSRELTPDRNTQRENKFYYLINFTVFTHY